MPGSLLYSPPSPRSRVSRHESTRSDRSDGSNTSQSSTAGKKVSFSKAVRVKKYSRPKKSVNGDLPNGGLVSNGGTGSQEKRFWFKVYKNKHRQSPDPKELSHQNSNDVIYYSNDIRGVGDVIRHDDDISYHANPSYLNYPSLTSESGTQTPHREFAILHPLDTSLEHAPLHPSQMPSELPHVKRNHVKKIVTRFNEEAIFTRQRSLEGDTSPPPSPLNYPRCCQLSSPIGMQRIPTPPPEPPIYHPAKQSTSSKFKKNPIVNGVKVMFGMAHFKKKEKPLDTMDSGMHRSRRVDHDVYASNGVTENKKTFKPYKTEITVSDSSEVDGRTARDHRLAYAKDIRLERGNELVPKPKGGLFIHNEEPTNGNYDDFFANEDNDEDHQRRSKYHVETWDSGNKLVYDTTDVNTTSSKIDNGELFCTVGEKHQLWQNNKRMVVVEEPSPRIIRRKAKSHSDLTNDQQDNSPHKPHVDKGISTEHLSSHKHDHKEDSKTGKSKDSWMKLWTTTRDKGVQCNQVPTSDATKPEEIYAFGKYKIVKPRNGVVTAYSNVPSLDKTSPKVLGESNHKVEYNSSPVSSSYQNGDIYSIVDKTKKKKSLDKKKTSPLQNLKSGSLFKSRSEPLYIGPPPKGLHGVNEDQQSGYFEDLGDHTVKTSRRSFGFRLTPGREEIGRKGFKNGRSTYKEEEENWYDIEDDLEAAERRKINGRNHRDISEVRQELADEEFASDLSSNGENRKNEGAGSVMREVDYKKREISYENVPRSDGEANQNSTTAANSGLWFRDAEEDYRREMAQSEVSYPAGSHVGSDRFHTVSRTEKAGKPKSPSSPRAYTLDRRHFKEQKKKNPTNVSGVKILVNGKEVNEKSGSFKKNKSHHHPHRKYRVNEDPSSVQSDPLYVRGGLAAAYQARQRAAVRRSNSSVAGIGADYRYGSPAAHRRYQTHSEASGASSETESAHARRPLVMYIPGISHRDRSPDEGDRSSGVNVARSQSMMTATRPVRITSKSSKSHHHKTSSKPDLYHRDEYLEDDDEIMPLASESAKKKPPKVPYESRKNSDIKRRHSMPKDTKFSWLKWKIKGKPSREP